MNPKTVKLVLHLTPENAEILLAVADLLPTPVLPKLVLVPGVFCCPTSHQPRSNT